MARYAAFLRAVSPMNAKMADLRAAFEVAGFRDVKTVLSSGNVVFEARPAAVASLERAAERAMQDQLGHAFFTVVRPVNGLRKLLASDPYQGFRLKPRSKRVITFLRERPSRALELPIELYGARILAIRGGAVFSVYTPSPKGAVFMTLIEKTFGKEVTTRTWDTVVKVTNAS